MKSNPEYVQRKYLHFLVSLVILLPPLASCGGRPAAPAAGAEISSQDQNQPTADQQGSQPGPAASTSVDPLDSFDPCQLLTDEEYETFFSDLPATDAAPENIGPYRSCMVWNQGGGKFITLQLTHQTAEAFKAEMESSAEMLDLELVPVEGLGDEAVFFAGLLRVRVGETVLQVLTWYQDLDQALSVSRQIAGLALPRLP